MSRGTVERSQPETQPSHEIPRTMTYDLRQQVKLRSQEQNCKCNCLLRQYNNSLILPLDVTIYLLSPRMQPSVCLWFKKMVQTNQCASLFLINVFNYVFPYSHLKRHGHNVKQLLHPVQSS